MAATKARTFTERPTIIPTRRSVATLTRPIVYGPRARPMKVIVSR